MYAALLLVLLAPSFGQQTNKTDSDLFNEKPSLNGSSNNTQEPQLTQITEDVPCTTDQGSDGLCVFNYYCNGADQTPITIPDVSGVIDIHIPVSCPTTMVCCPVSEVRPIGDPIIPKADPNAPKRDGCGWRNPEGVAIRTIQFEDEAKFAEFPWVCAILEVPSANETEPGDQKNRYVGGGSLIHPSVVLTVAHLTQGKDLIVRAGEWDTRTRREIYPYQEQEVDKVEVHKDYNKGNLFYDIALLFLKKPMKLTPNVGVACLPPTRERATVGLRCFAPGWGHDQFEREGSFSNVLKRVEVPVMDRKDCQDRLRETRLGRFFELHSSFMCAGGEKDTDSCRADGGAPLVCPIEGQKDRYVQSGIVAWGIGCGMDGIPGVYVDVSNLREWIDDKVVGRGLELDTYTF